MYQLTEFQAKTITDAANAPVATIIMPQTIPTDSVEQANKLFFQNNDLLGLVDLGILQEDPEQTLPLSVELERLDAKNKRPYKVYTPTDIGKKMFYGTKVPVVN
jgi:hypothetical protein